MDNDTKNKLFILLERFDELRNDLNNTVYNLKDNISCGKYIGEEELTFSKNRCVEVIGDIENIIKRNSGDYHG